MAAMSVGERLLSNTLSSHDIALLCHTAALLDYTCAGLGMAIPRERVKGAERLRDEHFAVETAVFH
jgi:hypothetical protein